MDARDMQQKLKELLEELDWSGGATKNDVLEHLAGRDAPLRRMVNEFVSDGSYPTVDRLMTVIPAEAWQAIQGDSWRGSESQFVEDVESNYAEGKAGRA